MWREIKNKKIKFSNWNEWLDETEALKVSGRVSRVGLQAKNSNKRGQWTIARLVAYEIRPLEFLLALR
jgi:hypothetical protein